MSGDAPNAASRWDAGSYAAHASFVPQLGAPVLELLAPALGERILDLGCGDGSLTAKIVEAGASVLGVDYAQSMVDAARALGLDAVQGNGEALAFEGEFDAVFSNAVLHWMLDGEAVAQGVFRALKPGGRFVGEMGGDGNVRVLRSSLREAVLAMGFTPPDADPQWYPTIPEFVGIYEKAGFTEIEAELIMRPTPLKSGAAQWFKTFRAGFLDVSGVPEKAREALAEDAGRRAEALLPHDADGVVLADYVRLRWRMKKPV